VTVLLQRASDGDAEAARSLYGQVYEQLRRMAHARMRRQPRGHPLDPTGLVHEAYIKLVGSEGTPFLNRKHFFAAAATAMRWVLADYARGMSAAKRTPHGAEVELEELIQAITPAKVGFLELDECIERLSERNPAAAEIVQLRLFGGLTIEQIVEVTGQAKRTVERLWKYGKTRLKAELEG